VSRVRDEVERFFARYRAAFDRLEASAIADLYDVPSMLTTNDGTLLWTTRDAILRNMVALCDHYRATGFRAATYEVLSVAEQLPIHAFTEVRWTIDHFPPATPTTFRTSYNLRRTHDWHVLLCTAYEER